MNQADVSKLVSKLRFNVKPNPRRLRNIGGPEGRLNKLRKTVTGLVKYERIELNYPRGDEARQYTERLISEAIRHGDCHKPTMELADYWLLEKELVHKLFKVLVPRYENSKYSFTRMYMAPRAYVTRRSEKAVIELKGNPYPSLSNKQGANKQLLQNILLDAAKSDYRQQKYAEMAKKIGKGKAVANLEKNDNQNTDLDPSLSNKHGANKQLIQNILVDAAKSDYGKEKYGEMAEKFGKEEAIANLETNDNASIEHSSQDNVDKVSRENIKDTEK